MGNPLHFIQASDTSAFAALHTEQGALPSQYEALQAYLKKIGLGRFGTLWAEPVTGQATPAGYASISWYTPLEGVGTPLSRLDAGEAEQARAALRRARGHRSQRQISMLSGTGCIVPLTTICWNIWLPWGYLAQHAGS